MKWLLPEHLLFCKELHSYTAKARRSSIVDLSFQTDLNEFSEPFLNMNATRSKANSVDAVQVGCKDIKRSSMQCIT